MNNQFALDEYKGTILRVAAIRQRGGQRSISIYAYDSYLRRYGTRNNIVRGHEITTVRYLEKKLYIGTNQNYFFLA